MVMCIKHLTWMAGIGGGEIEYQTEVPGDVVWLSALICSWGIHSQTL